MAKKVTIVEQYNAIIEAAKDVLTADQIEFLKDRAEKHANKNSNRKPTKQQEENEVLKAAILEGMEVGKAYTITDMTKKIPAVAGFTTSKVSALVRQLKIDELVIRTEEKGKAYFTKA